MESGDQVTNILYISILNHLSALLTMIYITIIVSIYLIWVDFNMGFTIALGIGFLINFVPTAYLHFQYYQKNKNEKYEIKTEELIRYKSEGGKDVFWADEIDSIKIYMSPALYKGSNFHLMAFEAYNYARIYLKSGNDFVITCLLAPKVENHLQKLKGVNIKRVKRLYNTLS